MTGSLLQVDGLHVAFGARSTWRDAVHGVNLRVAAGEVVGLVGESGSGKSLTALSVMGLLPPGAKVSSGRKRGAMLRRSWVVCEDAPLSGLVAPILFPRPPRGRVAARPGARAGC